MAILSLEENDKSFREREIKRARMAFKKAANIDGRSKAARYSKPIVSFEPDAPFRENWLKFITAAQQPSKNPTWYKRGVFLKEFEAGASTVVAYHEIERQRYPEQTLSVTKFEFSSDGILFGAGYGLQEIPVQSDPKDNLRFLDGYPTEGLPMASFSHIVEQIGHEVRDAKNKYSVYAALVSLLAMPQTAEKITYGQIYRAPRIAA